MYKLMAIDMDGTLLSKEKTISQENYEAIQNARRKGVKIVIATGRPLEGIDKYLTELNLKTENEYAISCNGALVQNINNGMIVSKTLMNVSDLKYLYALSKKLKVNIHALTPKGCITPKISKYSLLESELNGIPLNVVNFDSLNESTKIFKIMFIDEEPILTKAFNALQSDIFEKYSISRSEVYFLEFLNKNVSKGAGVEILANSLGINKNEVICIGDAGNDIQMIKYAGLGVAMANAFPEVKSIANYITKSNDENGVAYVINKFILNKEEEGAS